MTVETAFKGLVLNGRWAKEVGYLYRKYIGPVFGVRLLAEIRRSEIRAWHLGIPGVPGNRALSVLSRIYTNALEDSDAIPFNPCTGIKRHPEVARDRYASLDEVKKLLTLLDDSVNGIFVYTLLATGARPSFLERARREHLQGNQLVLKGKTGFDKVALTPAVLEQLAKLPVREDGLLFGIKNPRRYWRQICIRAGITGLWARDLRRTFASLAISNGVTIDVVGALLNHRNVQTTKRYAFVLSNVRQESAEIVGEVLERAAG